MSHTVKIKRGWGFAGEALEKEETVTAGQLVTVDEAIADSTTDGLVALTLDVSQLQAVYLESDQDVTLEFNDGTTPDETITLTANVPQLWSATDNGAALQPLGTDDITALYVTNASGSTANFKAIFIIDPTV